MKLVQVETVLKSDFFLASLADEFVECARHLISESYCRIHQVIDIKYESLFLCYEANWKGSFKTVEFVSRRGRKMDC